MRVPLKDNYEKSRAALITHRYVDYYSEIIMSTENILHKMADPYFFVSGESFSYPTFRPSIE